MCEFKVFRNGEKVFEDVVYARVRDGKVLLRDILGRSKEFQGCRIVEVDVGLEKLLIE